MRKIRVIDSHTGGEPTRLVLEGGPDLGDGPLAERVRRFREHFDAYRSAIVNEPRGSDPLVGALLVPPQRADCEIGVIFFNNVGYLGMCGHGTIGLIASLRHLRKLAPGAVKIDTPVGTVTATLHERGEVTVANVPSRRTAARVAVHVPGYGTVRGDIAWAGNWFFLIGEHSFELAIRNIEELTQFTWAVRQALEKNEIRGADGREIDHIELFSPSAVPGVDSKNFVLCPGKAYDRSPCGTGTSAKLACLAADGKLAEGEQWIQESVVGSRFTASYRREGEHIIPTITGAAYVNAETTLLLDERDPFCWGIR